MIISTEQAHSNLKNVLHNGRILINGLPLTANEIGGLIQGEQILFKKAIQFDKAQELVAKGETSGKPPMEPPANAPNRKR